MHSEKCQGNGDFQRKPLFPALYQLVKIHATLPVSTATVEHSFSRLKLVKSRLRSLCGQERLSDLLLFGIERDIPTDKVETSWNGCFPKEG